MTNGAEPDRGRAGRHAVVIGAGIIGGCTALELLSRGWQVTLVDPGAPGGEQAASYGNGAFLSPGSILPMSFPGMWKKVPGYLTDPMGPLTIRWTAVPRLLPWLWRFLFAGATKARFRRTAGLLNGLLHDAPARHAALAQRIGRPDLIRREGLIYAYADRAALEADGFGWQVRRENGVRLRELDRAELARREPDLSPRYGYGMLLEDGGHCHDPGSYVAAIAAQAVREGARLRQARVTGFARRDGRLTAVETDGAGAIPCDAAVICAGVWSKELALLAGDHVFLESERGYHVELADPVAGPRVPVMPQDGKMANTMTAGGLRASGQVELSSVSAPPDWRRAEVLLNHLRRTYPALAGRDDLRVKRWQGNRPSTPDGIPVIGRATGISGVFHAFGHGHVGLASGPRTAELIAALIHGETPALPLAPFSARRFG